MRRNASWLIVLTWSGLLIAASPALAQEHQPRPLNVEIVALQIDSGPVRNLGTEADVIYQTAVSAPGATWMRLEFDQALLSGSEKSGDTSYIILTSTADGAQQILRPSTLRQWRNSSAYFNGDTVLVELVAHPGGGVNRLAISQAQAGGRIPEPQESICYSTDDRELSNDPRIGRSYPIGCTVWMIDDCSNCFLTAGHCQTGTEVVLFNVPLSNSNGSYNFPHPDDQYAVDSTSMQGNGGMGVGNDWAYFGAFSNANTGLTPAEAQGAVFELAAAAPPADSQPTRITGYGTTSSPVSPTWNGAQKTHVGPRLSASGSTLRYQTDTTGGNSGSPIIDETTGLAIGIHTHGGCGTSGGGNHGTAIQRAELQAVLANPLGVCAQGRLAFDYPNGLPEFLQQSGTTIRVEVLSFGATPEPGTAELHYDAGDGWVVSPMTEISPNVYDAEFPPFDCRTMVSYYFSAEDDSGIRYYAPGGCNEPSVGLNAVVVDSVNILLARNFNAANGGWTGGAPGDTATSGLWEHGTPVGTAAQPSGDRSPGGTGKCWVTGASAFSLGDNDVDNGFTTLLTAVYDLSGDPNVEIGYWRWYSNHANGVIDDEFIIDINSGSGWVNVETIGPDHPESTGGWYWHSFRVADFVPPTTTVQMRFIAIDEGGGSIVEAAIDDFVIRVTTCAQPLPCPADIDGDGTVGLEDLLVVLGNFGMAEASIGDGDIDGDGSVGLGDLLALLTSFGPCP